MSPYACCLLLFSCLIADSSSQEYYDEPVSSGDDDGTETTAATSLSPPKGYKEGPMPIISDGFYSLVIFIYVVTIFVFMYFSFCYSRTPIPPWPFSTAEDLNIPANARCCYRGGGSIEDIEEDEDYMDDPPAFEEDEPMLDSRKSSVVSQEVMAMNVVMENSFGTAV